MRQRLADITPPVPRGRLARIGDHRLRIEEQQFPARQQRPEAERRDHPVRGRHRAHRRPGHQERVECVHIAVRHARIMRIGKGRIEMAAVAPDALAHRPAKRGWRLPSMA